MPRHLVSGAKIGSAIYLATYVAIWPQKCEHFFSATMSPAGQVGHTSYPSRSSVPSRGLCFLGKHDLEKVVRLGSSFLAGAFVFWENTTWKKVVRLGSAFLAGAFVFWEKHDLENVVRLGSAFLARAFAFWEKTTWKTLFVSDQRS